MGFPSPLTGRECQQVSPDQRGSRPDFLIVQLSINHGFSVQGRLLAVSQDCPSPAVHHVGGHVLCYLVPPPFSLCPCPAQPAASSG